MERKSEKKSAKKLGLSIGNLELSMEQLTKKLQTKLFKHNGNGEDLITHFMNYLEILYKKFPKLLDSLYANKILQDRSDDEGFAITGRLFNRLVYQDDELKVKIGEKDLPKIDFNFLYNDEEFKFIIERLTLSFSEEALDTEIEKIVRILFDQEIEDQKKLLVQGALSPWEEFWKKVKLDNDKTCYKQNQVRKFIEKAICFSIEQMILTPIRYNLHSARQHHEKSREKAPEHCVKKQKEEPHFKEQYEQLEKLREKPNGQLIIKQWEEMLIKQQNDIARLEKKHLLERNTFLKEHSDNTLKVSKSSLYKFLSSSSASDSDSSAMSTSPHNSNTNSNSNSNSNSSRSLSPK